VAGRSALSGGSCSRDPVRGDCGGTFSVCRCWVCNSGIAYAVLGDVVRVGRVNADWGINTAGRGCDRSRLRGVSVFQGLSCSIRFHC